MTVSLSSGPLLSHAPGLSATGDLPAAGHLLQVMPVAAYLCDPDGLITWFNEPAAVIWGCRPRLLDPDRRWCGSFRLMRSDGQPMAHDDCWTARAVREGRPFHDRELVIVHPDGRQRTALAHASPLFDAQGRIEGGLTILIDITEQVQLQQQLTDSGMFLRAAIDSMDAQTVLLDCRGRVILANRAWHAFAEGNGGRPDCVGEGINYLEICDRARGACPAAADVAAAIRAVLAGEAEPAPVKYACHGPAEKRWFLCSVRGFSRGRERFAIVSHLNITPVREAETRARHLSTVVEQTPASVIITDRNGNIEYVNAAFTESSGYTSEEVRGRNPRVLKSGLMPEETYRDLWQTLQAGHEWRGELQNRRKDGRIYWELAVISPLRDPDGHVTHYLAVKEDITARKLIEDELRVAANTDKLTGLANRSMLQTKLQDAIARRQVDPTRRFAVLFLDFDRFKLINDSLGHDSGDLLLQELAGRITTTLQEHLRDDGVESATAARFGGDEFVILLDGLASADRAVTLADRLLDAFARPCRAGDADAYLTASIGVVTSDLSDQSPEAVLRDADTAMYEAKLAGKGQYLLFTAAMRQRVQHRLHLENDLRRAVDERQLFLEFQPIVSLESGTVRGVEALARWRHPHRGIVSPAEFIPVAEDTGLIVPIGEWVLEEACLQFMRWRRTLGDDALSSMSVNLSRAQLMLERTPGHIRRVLESTGMPPQCLLLEVTESAVMTDVAAASRMLHAIRDTGVRIAIDDFGTGHSSLACLHEFPIDVLKIDRSFVANINRGRDFAALVHAVVDLAHNLQIRLVAEGVETADQAATLQSLDCELAQGYLFSKPLPADAVAAFVAQPVVLPSMAA